MTFAPLMDASALARELDRGGSVVVDCRFTLTDPPAGRAAYERGHIPGARYAHLDDDLARHPRVGEGRHPLPDAERFAATLGSWGIDRDTPLGANQNLGHKDFHTDNPCQGHCVFWCYAGSDRSHLF